METIKKTILRLYDSHLEKSECINTLSLGFEWFLGHFGHFKFNHQDIRGGDKTPTIILATTDDVVIDSKKLKTSFESNPHYYRFKKHLLTIGTVNTANKTYFYLQCNTDLLDSKREMNIREIKDIMRNRTNKELFEHVDKYFKS